MSFKKGATITDASGAIYTLNSFHILSQKVKYTLTTAGQEPVPGEMPASQWKELSASVNDLELADIVNKAPEPGNGADTAVAQAPVKTEKLTILKGMVFQMMDKSRWKISEYNRNTKQLVAINQNTEVPQDFTLQQLTELVNDGHVKIIS